MMDYIKKTVIEVLAWEIHYELKKKISIFVDYNVLNEKRKRLYKHPITTELFF